MPTHSKCSLCCSALGVEGGTQSCPGQGIPQSCPGWGYPSPARGYPSPVLTKGTPWEWGMDWGIPGQAWGTS